MSKELIVLWATVPMIMALVIIAAGFYQDWIRNLREGVERTARFWMVNTPGGKDTVSDEDMEAAIEWRMKQSDWGIIKSAWNFYRMELWIEK